MQNFQQNLQKLEAADTQVLGVSMDSTFSNAAWAEKIAVTFPLLSDWGAPATALRWLYEPETAAESWRTMALCRYNPRHNLARQLRPPFLWSVPARLRAWLRFWRLCRWWRMLSCKGERPDPAGEIV